MAKVLSMKNNYILLSNEVGDVCLIYHYYL